jgi:hypothetical protein
MKIGSFGVFLGLFQKQDFTCFKTGLYLFPYRTLPVSLQDFTCFKIYTKPENALL